MTIEPVISGYVFLILKNDLIFNWNIINRRKSKQNITRDIEVKNNLTIARGKGGRNSGEKGFWELL